MKKNSVEATAVLTGKVAETDESALKPAQQRISPQAQPEAKPGDSESDRIDTQDSNPDAPGGEKLSRYRRSVKLLQEN